MAAAAGSKRTEFRYILWQDGHTVDLGTTDDHKDLLAACQAAERHLDPKAVIQYIILTRYEITDCRKFNLLELRK